MTKSRWRTMLVLVALMLLSAIGCSAHRSTDRSVHDDVVVSPDIELRRIGRNVWVHTTYFEYEGYGRVSGNGLLIVGEKEACLIDLPTTDEQTATLFDWVVREFGVPVKTVVPTHSHVDCAGGIAEAHRRGAVSYALNRTSELMVQGGLEKPRVDFEGQLSMNCGEREVRLMYPGAGHTVDNIVAWLPQERILFGGCLVKSLEATGPGNVADADLESWPGTVRKVKEQFKDAATVIPGHGSTGGLELLDHTIGIVSQPLE